MDNVFIERLWRSRKYEEIHLREHATVTALRSGIANWFDRYNGWWPHEAPGNLTPGIFYQTSPGGTPDAARATIPKAAWAPGRGGFWKPPLRAAYFTPPRSVAFFTPHSFFPNPGTIPLQH
jgi:hypothetical protein